MKLKYLTLSQSGASGPSLLLRCAWLLVAALCFFLSAVCLSSAAEPAGPKELRKPNIILIMADDLGWGDTHPYGADPGKFSTLHINRVFIEGRLYRNAHSPSSVCSPTRFSVMTGAYPWRDNRVPRHLTASEPLVIREGEETVASLLKEAGYATACVGKWHLGAQRGESIDWNKPLTPGPNDVGFDYFFGVINSHNQAPYVWVENDKIMGRAPGEVIEIEGNQKELKGIEHKRETTQITATLAQRAGQFIDQNKDRPFFLYYAACTVHTPLEPGAQWKGKSKMGDYGDSVQEFDWQVGRILSKLSQHNLHQDTLLIVTSDNGALTRFGREYGHSSNGPLRGEKASIYEGGHRVPFIARWLGKIPVASESLEIVSLVDFIATACAAAGVELPAHVAPDSHNLLPEMMGVRQAVPVREATVCVSKFSAHLSIQQGPWKMIVDREPAGVGPLAKFQQGRYGPDALELYHLDTDPAETKNYRDQRPDVVERLQALLQKYEEQGFSRPGFKASSGRRSKAK